MSMRRYSAQTKSVDHRDYGNRPEVCVGAGKEVGSSKEGAGVVGKQRITSDHSTGAIK